ncbi:hypothetical protein EDB19DRAFT_1916007 [Suillus lakei]|nr:hypothetical protein EDB19DRAFT_1916007 [Suillus lakei]
MSSLLSKSFDALEIATTQPTIIKRRPCILVRPKKQPHRQFYGYPVSREWLVHFAERQCPETLRDRREKGYKCDAAMRAYEHIAICTSTSTNTITLDLQLCFHPQRGSALQEYIYACTIPGGYDVELSDEEIFSLFDIDEVYLFFVCTDEEDSL